MLQPLNGFSSRQIPTSRRRHTRRAAASRWSGLRCPRFCLYVACFERVISGIQERPFCSVLFSFCFCFAFVLLPFCFRFASVLLSFCFRFAFVLLSFAFVLLSFCASETKTLFVFGRKSGRNEKPFRLRNEKPFFVLLFVLYMVCVPFCLAPGT